MTRNTNKIYDASSIQTRKGLEAMRHTPQLFLPDLETPGITHTIKEIVTNSVDEMLVSPENNVKVKIFMFTQEETGRVQFLVTDTGRGVPILTGSSGINPFYNCMVIPHTSGKFNQNTYAVAGGQFGVGHKITVATAKRFTGVSFRPEGVGFIHVVEGVAPSEPTLFLSEEYRHFQTGLISFWEPDKSVFFSLESYAKEGYLSLINFLREIVYFRKLDIEVYKLERLIPEKLWKTEDPNFLLQEIEKIEKKSQLVWSGLTEDSLGWIRSYWKLNKNFSWKREIKFTEDERKICDDVDPQISKRIHAITLQFFYIKGDRTGGCFSLVNFVHIPDVKKSDQTKVVLEIMKRAVSTHIEDKDIKKFFLSLYNLPLYLAVGVDYEGARFSNATKTAWVDPEFRLVYMALVSHWLEQTDSGKEIVKEFYELIQSDIEARYNESLGKKISTKSNMSIRSLLGDMDKNFCDAKPTDGNRMNCELFLFEGKSAGGGEDYDTEHQATWPIQGKPKNILKGTNGSFSEALRNVLEDDILSKILHLLRYDPREKDTSNLYFGKVCITPDADAHGGHIASLLLTAFQTVTPDLVNIPGFFQIIVPPYYQICLDKNPKYRVYIRDKDDLPSWCAEHIFAKRLKIKARYYPYLNLPDKEIESEAYITFTKILFEYGLIMENISNRLQISPEILEALCKCTYYLTPRTMNTERVRECIMANRVTYEKDTNTITVSYGETDIPIPLMFVREELYENVLKILNRLKWREWYPVISTETINNSKETPISFFNLYKLMKRWRDGLISIKPLKGLGSMDSKDLTYTCMDPRNRKSLVIKGVGDVKRIIRLMEKDTAERKKIVSEYFS